MKALCVQSFAILCMCLARAEGQQFQPGDVVVTATSSVGISGTTSRLLWYDGAAALKGQLLSVDDQILAGVAFNASGVLHVALGGGIAKVGSTGAVTPFFAPPPAESVFPLSFARDGGIYAGTSGIVAHAAIHVDLGGVRQARFGLNDIPEAVDLGSDQCTLYYLTLNTLGRYDVCSGNSEADVATLPGGGIVTYDFRILPDQTFLLGQAGHLTQLNRAGQIVRQFGGAGFKLALDIDPRYAWVSGSAGHFSKIDIATGNVVLGPFDTGMETIAGMTVFGEPRAALTSSVPALSLPLLLALTALLLIVGIFRMRC